MGRRPSIEENTAILIGKASKKATSVYWLLYFGRTLFPGINKVALKVLSPDAVQVFPDPAGFKITFPSKGYEQWMISANRLISFYLSAIPMSSRQFNRILKRKKIKDVQLRLELSISPPEVRDEHFPKVVFNTKPLIELLEEITSEKIDFGRVKFPITLRRHEKFPEGLACFYFYDFGKKGLIVTMRIPPELYEILKSLNRGSREKTVVDIHVGAPTTLEIALYPGEDIKKVLEYGYIEVTRAMKSFVEGELKKMKGHKKKVCIPILSISKNGSCGIVEISWLDLLKGLNEK